LQESQLHHHQKQKEAFGPFGDQEVLPFVPQAHTAQRSEMTLAQVRVRHPEATR
jgi:hypothetical protein